MHAYGALTIRKAQPSPQHAQDPAPSGLVFWQPVINSHTCHAQKRR